MKDKDIIQLLKDNLYAFGLWPEAYGQETGEAMQAKASEIGTGKFWIYEEGWSVVRDDGFYQHFSYRLREDYTEEPEAGVEKTGLEMKYFILKPKSKPGVDVYAMASRAAMLAYADIIMPVNEVLSVELQRWAIREAEANPDGKQ